MELNDKDLGGKKQQKRVKDVHEKERHFCLTSFAEDDITSKTPVHP